MPKTKVYTESRPTLKEAQEAVGGFVELVPLLTGQMLVNENGIMERLPINTEASTIANQTIRGDVLILKGKAMWD